MAYLTFYILKFFGGGGGMPPDPLEAHAYGTLFSSRLLLYFNRLLQNLLRTLSLAFACAWSRHYPPTCFLAILFSRECKLSPVRSKGDHDFLRFNSWVGCVITLLLVPGLVRFDVL